MKPRIIILVICLFVLYSCISDVDFDQADDIEITNSHLISLVHFDLDASNFLDDMNNEVLFYSDTTEIPIFNWAYNENHLEQADFEFKLANSFDRRFAMQMELLDHTNSTTYIFAPLIVDPFELDFISNQTIGAANMPSVINTKKIVVTILLDSGLIPLDPALDMNVELQSGAEFHYRITTND